MNKSAILSTCGTYRYSLTRDWNDQLPHVVFIMLNPSIADASVDDPTIRKCIGFATRSGFGSLGVVNLFAYRATDPNDLKRMDRPVGPDNDRHIERAVLYADRIVCAWGANARNLVQTTHVLQTINHAQVCPYVLQLLTDGTPAHPLMLPYSVGMTPWEQ